MLTALVPLLLCAVPLQEPAAERLPLKVLYAGNVGTPYTAAWVRFLGEHTEAVKSVDASELRAEDFAGFDVLVIDGEVERHGKDGELQLHIDRVKLHLDDLQGVPVLLMGGQGGGFSDELKLKTAWGHG